LTAIIEKTARYLKADTHYPYAYG